MASGAGGGAKPIRRARPAVSATLVEVAMTYPEATEDFPWGERVAKVRGKVFAFLGADDRDDASVSLKLPESVEHALSFGAAAPTGYGLGRAGWVTIRLDHPECPEIELLLDWLEESYRTIAPARLVKVLDAAWDPPLSPPPPRAAKKGATNSG